MFKKAKKSYKNIVYQDKQNLTRYFLGGKARTRTILWICPVTLSWECRTYWDQLIKYLNNVLISGWCQFYLGQQCNFNWLSLVLHSLKTKKLFNLAGLFLASLDARVLAPKPGLCHHHTLYFYTMAINFYSTSLVTRSGKKNTSLETKFLWGFIYYALVTRVIPRPSRQTFGQPDPCTPSGAL